MKQKHTLKLAAVTLVIIGAGTAFFNAMAETAMAARVRQVESVPTSYQIPGSPAASLPDPERREESNEEVNYHVNMDSLNTEMPTEMDLTMEEAARAGAQHLKNIFGLDLEGAYVYMMYTAGTETFPRAFWMGDVLFEQAQTPESTRWTYLIDAVTGELFTISYGRHLNASPSVAYDAALEKDYSLYAELAQKKVEECSLLDSPVNRVEYNCGRSG